MIWTLKKEGRSETYIAARIGCSVSTISRELERIKVYFAKPYHSWERGTNENRNGVVREETSGTRFAVLDRPGDSSVRLDGKPLATVRRAEGLPRNYGVLYRETAPFTLGYGAGSAR